MKTLADLTTISLGYRDSGVYSSETTVIADTLAIAGSAQLASVDKNENKRFIEYQAPLQKTYQSCIGIARSQKDPHYSFRFQNKKVYFRVDLTNIPDGFGAGITYYKVIGLRPYVIWTFVD